MTLQCYIEKTWGPNLERRKVRPSTLASYWSMLEQHVLPTCGGMDVALITPRAIEILLRSLSSLSPKYQRNIVLMLQAIFTHAAESGAIERSPMRKSHMPICRRQEKPSWTGADMSKILAAAPERFHLLLSLIAFTGMRIGEILALRWADVDLVGATLTVCRSSWRAICMDSTKNGAVRSVPLPTTLCICLGDLLAAERLRWSKFDSYDLVFRGDDGKPYSPDYLRRAVLYPILDKVGLPRGKRDSGLHRFRHSAGSIVVSRTGNLKLAQQLLGHSSVSTTADIYTHVQPSEIKGAVDLLEREILDPPLAPFMKGGKA